MDRRKEFQAPYGNFSGHRHSFPFPVALYPYTEELWHVLWLLHDIHGEQNSIMSHKEAVNNHFYPQPQPAAKRNRPCLPGSYRLGKRWISIMKTHCRNVLPSSIRLAAKQDVPCAAKYRKDQANIEGKQYPTVLYKHTCNSIFILRRQRYRKLRTYILHRPIN